MLPLVAIDPGVRTGWAFAIGGEIRAVGTTSDLSMLPSAPVAVIEMPRIYPTMNKWKGDPQDIVKLAFRTGLIAAGYRLYQLVEPRSWRGGAPEKVIRKRTTHAITPAEWRNMSPPSLSAHAWDALGIMCHALGRFRH